MCKGQHAVLSGEGPNSRLLSLSGKVPSMLSRSLAAIGVVGVDSRPQSDLLALLAGAASQVFECDKGEYRLWRSKEGAELWFHVARDTGGPSHARAIVPDSGILAVTPFHTTRGVVRVTVTASVTLHDGNPLAGAYVCYLPSQREGGRELQIVLEMVPYALTHQVEVPFEAYVELLGLVTEATIYTSLTDYFVRVTSSQLVAPGTLVPLIEGSERDAADLRCVAVVTGLITECERLANSLTGLAYWRLIVATERGHVDLVAPEAVLGGKPAVGVLIQAKARLIGRTSNRLDAALRRDVHVEGTATPPQRAIATG